MLVEAASLSALLSVGAEAGASNGENSLVQAIRSGVSNSISQTSQQIAQLNIQPTLTIRPGFPVRVIVTHDLAPMIARFMATDRAFAKARRNA